MQFRQRHILVHSAVPHLKYSIYMYHQWLLTRRRENVFLEQFVKPAGNREQILTRYETQTVKRQQNNDATPNTVLYQLQFDIEKSKGPYRIDPKKIQPR